MNKILFTGRDNMLNSVCLMGRLCGDPELKTTTSGVSVCSFRMAVDRTYQPKGQDKQADFINIVCWRNTAEFVSKYMRKGQMIAVQGSIQTNSYTDRDGKSRTSFDIVADNVFFAEKKAESAVFDQGEGHNSHAQKSADFEDVTGDDDDLPF